MKSYFPWILILFLASSACAVSTDSGTSSSSSGDDSSAESDNDAQTAVCDDTGITAYGYLMAFHACAADCSDPSNHDVYLAGSDNGADWALIDEFASFAGSVPELVYADNTLFIHTPDEVRTYNACFEELSSGEVDLASAEDSGGYVDPSLIVAGEDVYLFYLPGIIGQDPAGCTTYPCTKEIHSALADDATQTAFTQISGERAQIELAAGTASDPEIIATDDGTYLLYVSSGQSVLVFTGTSLSGTFSSPDGASPREISDGSGGVPSAIQAPDGNVWLYVTKNEGGIEIIRRAVSPDGVTPIANAEFSTVVDATIHPDFAATMSVSSPSVIAWPDSAWTMASP